MEDIIKMRHTLHKNPELSGEENQTAKRISEFINNLGPLEEYNLGKTGKAFVINSDSPENGPSVMFRAELDALPIQEENEIDYRSEHKKIAHVCGHDGHMAIVLRLAQKVAREKPKKGRVIFLFQPAEETGQGAEEVVADPNFEIIKPDYAYALHNIPGVEKNRIIIKEGNFAAASKGMLVKFRGKTSHAAEPENGINPSIAIAKIVLELNKIINAKEQFTELTLLTIVNIKVGEIAFGTSAGYGELRMTLRAFKNADIELLTKKSEELIKKISEEEKLKISISYTEVFPVTKNHEECFQNISAAIEENGLETETIDRPYKWSEDFGYFSTRMKTGFFGLGSGKDQPSLHNPDFDFPDDIIETGAKVFMSICKKHNY